MNKEEIKKLEDYLKSLPKIKQNMSIPVTTNIGINLDDLMNAVKRLKKVPTFDDLLKENQKLKGSLQTYEILLKANVEENQQLKKQLQQKEDIINKAREYCNHGIKEYITDNGFVEETLKDVKKILDNKG